MPEATGPVSIHDVMPETLEAVAGLLALAGRAGWARVTLLVVPGLDWDTAGIARLRHWQAEGHQLAGHGWRHHVEAIRGLRHHLHSRLISRHVAEHLALDAEGILALMRRCHAWFPAHGLAAPTLYVPPAWALGPLPAARLGAQPFRRVETLAGIRDARSGRLEASPLLGYEADGRLRAAALRSSNALARALARWRQPRLALHPFDGELALAPDLAADLYRFAASGDRASKKTPGRGARPGAAPRTARRPTSPPRTGGSPRPS